jgi:hypothetical protein
MVNYSGRTSLVTDNNNWIQFRFIYLLKQQSVGQLQEEHEATKVQVSKAKQISLSIREY